MPSVADQHRKNAAIQQRWSTLAKREGSDNLRQARRFESLGQPVRARFYQQEANIDFRWAARRQAEARRERKLAR